VNSGKGSLGFREESAMTKSTPIAATQVFKGPKLKIERANKHIHDLGLLLDTFLKTNFYRIGIEKDPESGSNNLIFETTIPIPPEVALIIGDAVHNLRSALDLLACEIITRAGATPSKWTRFPFSNNRKELISTLKSGKIKIAGSWIIDLIINEIKPYKGGNEPLYALHNLDIMDKHKLLIPIAAITRLLGVNTEDDRGNRFHGMNFVIRQGGKINAISGGTNFKITNYGQPSFDIFFDKGQIFEGKPVFPTLHQLSQLVSGIVQAIEKAYLAKSKTTN
jgi:hypothetical protein